MVDEKSLRQSLLTGAREGHLLQTVYANLSAAQEERDDLANELKVLSKAQRWEEMPKYISDEVLNTYAVVGTYDEIADKLIERYGDFASSVEFSIPASNAANRERLHAMAAKLQALPPPALSAWSR